MKRLASVGIMLTVMAVLLAGCSCHTKMVKNANKIEVTMTPDVVVKKGGSAVADIKVTFPAKYFNRRVVMKVTPVLAFDGGEITGTPKFLQGEGVKDNYTVIPVAGGSYTQSVVFPYDKRASVSTLELRVEAMCCEEDGFEHVATLVAGSGISDVLSNLDLTSNLEVMPNNFKREVTVSETADLKYLVNSSTVRDIALSAEQVKMFEDFVNNASNNEDMAISGLYSKGYASPEGPVKFNDDLSKKRSESAKTAVEKQLAGIGGKIDAAAYGEDWEGFEKLVAASSIADKDILLQVLRMYSSPVQREEQIRNMAVVYTELKKDILPELRRAQLVANATVTGKTDAELRSAFTNNPNTLNAEELLFAATLINDNDAVVKGYRSVASKFNNDARVLNNYGVALLKAGEVRAAKDAFTSASRAKAAPEITNNLGATALVEGNYSEATNYLRSLNSTNAKANMALVNAVGSGSFNDTNALTGYNLAVAQLSQGEVSKAKAQLNSGNLNTAQADYLRAIVAMREGNSAAAVTELNKAFEKDPSLKAKAKSDIEFVKINDKF